MNSSQSIVNLAPALIKFKKDMCIVGKSGEAKFSNRSYKWAKLEDIIEDINERLCAYDLTIMQPLAKREDNVQETYLIHASGEWIGSQVSLIPVADWPMDSWQDLGKCITYARRYSILALLGMGQVDDPDDDDGQLQAKKTYDNKTYAPQQNRLLNENVVGPKITEFQLDEIVAEIQKLDGSIKTEVITQVASYNKVKVLSDLRQDQFAGVMRVIKAKQKTAWHGLLV